uniref:Uncharacterized protein n=1 Tax=Panagrolaimus davidi TaxID=227884 RepID=A0A914P2B0_9BILA
MGGFDERNDDDDIHIPLPRPVDLDDVFGVAVEQFARREELPDRPEPNIYEERLKEENVINFGIDFKANKISFSESLHSTIEYKDLDIMDKDLFREICKYSKNQFGCLCLCLDNSYKNQKRKEMVENGKDYGFLNIQILDSISSKCLAMLLKAKNELQNDQIYDDSTEKTIINFRGDTDYIVTIDIDGNGIFTLKYDETSSEGRQNNEIWFENFIRGQNNPQIHIIPQTTPSADKNIKAVGIDFGTSKCCVATSKRDGIEVVAVENTGGRIMPSYVAFDEKHTKCGQIVVDRLPYKAAFSVFDLKRIIGKEYEFIVPYPDWPFQVLKYNNDVKIECKTWNDDIQQQSPEEILSVLLKHLKVKTEEFQGESLEEVVITVPGTFTQRQINSTFEAACQAGWTNISFLPEPIAALFTYFEKYPSKNFTGCVFDLGGGNLNVWIFKIKNGKILLLNNDGDTCLGGRNFDKALFTYLYARLKRQFNIDMTETKKYKLITDCLVIKHSLSTQNEYT